MKWLEKWAVLLCSFFICNISFGQGTEKEAKEFYNKANYPKAIEIYTRLLEKDSMNYGRNYKTGVSYLRSNIDKTKAIRYFERAMLSYQRKPAVFYNLARAYHLNNQFDKAIEMYNMYNVEDAFGKKRVETEKLIESCYYARELIKLPRPVKFINLGPMVNSPFPDYHPHVSKDGTTLVYTSRRSGTPEANGIYPADVMSSQFVKEKFKKAQSAGSDINSSQNEQAVGLSDDGNTVFISRDEIKGVGNLYWFKRVKRDFEDGQIVPEIGTSACLSEDGRTMYFASNRPKGYGGLDLYITRILPDGKWGIPQNMGPNINTSKDEDMPALSTDGNKLYFSSNGYPSMGGFDIYYSAWDADNSTWSLPHNIGYPINTPDDNHNITFSNDGKFSYVSALRKEGLGDLDIYKIEMNTDRPMYSLLRVKVTHEGEPTETAEGEPIISARDTIFVSSPEPKKSRPAMYLPNPNTGYYTIILQPGRYVMEISSKNFQKYNEVIFLSEYDYTMSIQEREIVLRKL